MVAVLNFLVFVVDARTGCPFHIGLTGTKPDFTDHDVVQDEGISFRNGYGVWPAGFGCFDEDFPLGFMVCEYFIYFIVPTAGNGNRGIGVRPSPEWNLLFLLQHHMIGKQCGNPNPGTKGKTEEKQGSKKKTGSCHDGD